MEQLHDRPWFSRPTISLNCKILANTEDMTHEQWLEIRRQGIGGSDVAAILGLNPWRSAFSVYYSKVIGEDQEENLAMRIGRVLEPLLREELGRWYQDREYEAQIVQVPYVLQHPENPILLGNLDGVVVQGDKVRGAELKNTNMMNARQLWTEDTVPDMYYLQVQHYMGVTGLEMFDLGTLINGREFYRHEIPANKEVIEIIDKKVTDFWNNYILTKTMPATAGAPDDTQILKQLYPEESGEPFHFPEHYQDLYDSYKQLKEEEKEIQRSIEEHKQRMMQAMQDAPVAYFPNGKKATWKTVEKKEYVVKASSSRVFRVY